jgi:signal transduction histidine kinase
VSSFMTKPDIAAYPSSPAVRRAVERLHGPILLALLYFFGAELAFYIGTLSDQIFALFWPPNVILFCALLMVPRRDWWVYIAAAFPAHVIAELGVGMPWLQLVVAFATNCMVAVLNAYGVRRFLGDLPWSSNFNKLLAYLVITVGVGPALSALGGAFVPILGGGPLSDYWTFWSHWYFGNALPNLTVGLVFLIWLEDRARWRQWRPSRRDVEPVLIGVALMATCFAATAASERLATSNLLVPEQFLRLPLILWAAVRFGAKGASGAILITAITVTWCSMREPGLFPGEDPERSLLTLQLFLMSLAIPVVLLGALIDESKRAEQKVRELAASLVRAQDEERRRIARDLHDSTGQNLIAATLIADRIELALPKRERSVMRQLDDVLQQAIREIRTISYLLHPPLLEEAGLDLALRNFVSGFIERTGIAVDLEISPQIGRLPQNLELVLFRVAQEALGNIARHSRSRTALIRLDCDGTTNGWNSAMLTVEDAGKGMPEAARARHLGKPSANAPTGVGLASMRERLHQIGGRLEIESVVGRTTLRATIPIPAETAH